ncbi:caspase family protein [Streptomyces rubiginosohelvolus]|uniref:caspase family protein n=1 Tax=Streptomyces rubiginosohelvolus TaxID=67362 RepID=UPI003F925E09
MSTSDTPQSVHITGIQAYQHPSNYGAHMAYEHGPDRATPVGAEASGPSADGPHTELRDRLNDRLQALHHRACEVRQSQLLPASLVHLSQTAQEMRVRHAHALTRERIRWYVSGKLQPPVQPAEQQALVSAVMVMSSWAGETPDLGDWCELIARAARERMPERVMSVAQPGRPSLSVGMTRKRIDFVTPDEVGTDEYREFCSRAGLLELDQGWALLRIEAEDGRRISLLTQDSPWARMLAASARLEDAEITSRDFHIQLDGWPTESGNIELPVHQPSIFPLIRKMGEARVNPARLAIELGATEAEVGAWITGRAVPRDDVERQADEYLTAVLAAAAGKASIQDSSQQFFACWERGAAVLIGVSDYQEMAPVQSIANNLESLQDVMVRSLGIPSEHVFVVKNPESSADVHEAVDRAAEAADPASGALLVYFAGHGWTDSRGRLALGLVRSSRSRSWSAFDFNNLRIQIADSQIGKRVVILDSCYSGAALDVLGPDELASAAVIDGTYVLTSANSTTAALAPAGERFTTFTGHLIKALNSGIPQGPEVISTDTLFRYIERIAKARGLPAPCRQIGGDGDRLEIAANKWGQQ